MENISFSVCCTQTLNKEEDNVLHRLVYRIFFFLRYCLYLIMCILRSWFHQISTGYSMTYDVNSKKSTNMLGYTLKDLKESAIHMETVETLDGISTEFVVFVPRICEPM